MGNFFCCCGCCTKEKKDNNNNNNNNAQHKQKRKRKVRLRLTPYEQQLFGEEVDNTIKPISDTSANFDELIVQYDVPNETINSYDAIIETRGYKILYDLVISKDSKVYQAIQVKSHKTVACKIYDIPGDDKRKLRYTKAIANEVFISKQLKHEHIIHYIDYFVINSNCFIFMSFASGGNLTNYIKSKGPLDEQQCRTWFAQMVSAVHYMHSKCISHNDIKPDNIVIDSKHRLLLTDFGLSRVSYSHNKDGTQLSIKFCGTKQYLAPEIIVIEVNRPNPDYVKTAYNPFQADIWALGITLYQMYTKKYPYTHGLAYSEVLNFSLTLRYKLKLRLQLGNKKPNHLLVEILRDMLDPDWKTRITISELASHQWLNDEVINIVNNVKD